MYRPRPKVRYGHIDSLFSETVDWKLIRKHWKDWLQLVLSVQAGRISSSTLIRQLSHRSDANILSRVANELGSIYRTIFLLEWISDQLMRQDVTAVTNKVEAYHGFSKWLSFGGEVIAENDPDEQQKHLRYNDLLASAVILQNVIDLTRIIADLRREGWTITEEELSFLSPYLTHPAQWLRRQALLRSGSTDDALAVVDRAIAGSVRLWLADELWPFALRPFRQRHRWHVPSCCESGNSRRV